MSEAHEGAEAIRRELADLRCWILGLAAVVLLTLAAGGAPRGVLAGFGLGAVLALWSLSDMAAAAAEQILAGPDGAPRAAHRRFARRWAVILAALLAGHALGASPAAGAAGLLLLQAAMLCRSIAALSGGSANAGESGES